MQILDSLMSN